MRKVFAGKVRKTGFFQKAGFPGDSDRIFGIYYILPITKDPAASDRDPVRSYSCKML
jgi:hypothetical protein